jgi:hypothetical protein
MRTMKCTTGFASWLGLALSSAIGCDPGPGAPPPGGGQSGDDGGGHDLDMDPPIEPGIPENPCESETLTLGANDATVFGANVPELIEHLELGSDTPLFWVAFDAVAPTTFEPGPGQTSLALAITLRAGESAEQVTLTPKVAGAVCAPDFVSVPVQVALTTADGALDERFDGTLAFSNANVARLTGRLPANELAGTFSFGPIGAPSQGWQMQALDLDVDLWPGGSRGSLSPLLTQLGPPSPPSAPTAPASAIPSAAAAAPLVPDHWSSVAVWPRREVCNDGRGGVPVDASDRVIGVSPLDTIEALVREEPWVLASDDGTAPVRVTLTAPSGVLCVSTNGAALEFDVPATLRAEGATAGSALENLDASTILRVGGRAAADGSGLVELRWARRDVVFEQTRDAFEATTGVLLDAPEEYRDIWWSWHGLETRAGSEAPWDVRATFTVSSLNAQQAADIARIVALGGPGAGIGLDAEGFPILPGDSLLDAELSP